MLYSPLVSILVLGNKSPLRHRNTCNSHRRLGTSQLWRNPKNNEPLSSLDNIVAVAENVTMENAIFIAQTEIACLDDLSLNGDIPDDVSDTD